MRYHSRIKLERQLIWHFSFRFPACWDLESDPEEMLKKISLIYKELCSRYGAEVNSFVFMYDHVHSLISGSKVGILDNLIETLKKEIAMESYFFARIENQSQHSEVYRYIYRNPLEMGFCQRPQDFPYSSLNWQLGYRPSPLPIVDQFYLLQNPFQVLRFIEEPQVHAGTPLN